MGKFEVTVGQFKAFVNDSLGYRTEAERAGDPFTWREPRFARPQNDDQPVVCVSWNDAQEFCKWLSKKTGQQFRLHYEAEWEYCCRAGTTTRYSFGEDDKDLGDHGWFKGNAGGQTRPVGKKKPNPWGLHDMHGNVFERCQDGQRQYRKEKVTDPVSPSAAAAHAIRGGAWITEAGPCRAAYRECFIPSVRNVWVGFRVMRSR
jgi:formylglycine-generating enzyme required for sulfatase activity